MRARISTCLAVRTGGLGRGSTIQTRSDYMAAAKQMTKSQLATHFADKFGVQWMLNVGNGQPA